VFPAERQEEAVVHTDTTGSSHQPAEPNAGKLETELLGLKPKVAGKLLAHALCLVLGDEMSNLVANDGGQPLFVLDNREDARKDHDLSVRQDERVFLTEVKEHDLPRVLGGEARSLEHAASDSTHELDLFSSPGGALRGYDSALAASVVHDPSEVLVGRGDEIVVGDGSKWRAPGERNRGTCGEPGGRETEETPPRPFC
jgi:hypothetical protein